MSAISALLCDRLRLPLSSRMGLSLSLSSSSSLLPFSLLFTSFSLILTDFLCPVPRHFLPLSRSPTCFPAVSWFLYDTHTHTIVHLTNRPPRNSALSLSLSLSLPLSFSRSLVRNGFRCKWTRRQEGVGAEERDRESRRERRRRGREREKHMFTDILCSPSLSLYPSLPLPLSLSLSLPLSIARSFSPSVYSLLIQSAYAVQATFTKNDAIVDCTRSSPSLSPLSSYTSLSPTLQCRALRQH